MKVIQLLPTLSYGDGVGNDTLAIDRILKENGYATMVYAENIDRRISERIVKPVDKLPSIMDDDIILYHLSTGTELNYRLPKLNGRKVIIYHNITPADWFKSYDRSAEMRTMQGINGMRYLADTAEYCLADSLYNKNDLIENGYKCDIDVLPIIIPFEDYKKTPDASIIKKYENDGYTNIIFTGRIAPNKKQEDVIETFYYYKKYYNPRSRLFLVGSYDGMECYYERLKNYVEKLGVKDVYFTGHVKFDAILAYYRIADIFLCMSEHEGFCIPLIEAMYFDVPIITYGGAAIPETLGGSGICLKEKDTLLASGLINRLIKDPVLKEKIVGMQKKRLEYFESQKISKKFLYHLKKFILKNHSNESIQDI